MSDTEQVEPESQLSPVVSSDSSRGREHKRSDRNLYQRIVRETLSEDEIRAQVAAIREVLTGATKIVWATCGNGKCRRKVSVEVVDAHARIRALQELQAAGWGKPEADVDERRAGFVLYRTIVMPDGAELVTHDERETVV